MKPLPITEPPKLQANKPVLPHREDLYEMVMKRSAQIKAGVDQNNKEQSYKASGYEISPVRFYDSNEDAIADMKRLAEKEAIVSAETN